MAYQDQFPENPPEPGPGDEAAARAVVAVVCEELALAKESYERVMAISSTPEPPGGPAGSLDSGRLDRSSRELGSALDAILKKEQEFSDRCGELFAEPFPDG